MGCAQGEGGLATGAEVGFEGVPDACVGLGQVVLKRTCCVVSIYAHIVCKYLPVLSYTLRKGIPAAAVQAAISQTSLTSPSKPAFP